MHVMVVWGKLRLVLSQRLIQRIQSMELAPSILGVKAPMDCGLGGIALPFQGLDFPAEDGLVRDAPSEGRREPER